MATTLMELIAAFGPKFCQNYGCAKCWRGDFERLARAIPDLKEQLGELDLQTIRLHRNWRPVLYAAFLCLPTRRERREVLTAWLRHAQGNVWFTDEVIFYYIRDHFQRSRIGERWLESAVALATELRDQSLVESLVWLLKSEVRNYPALMAIALRDSVTLPNTRKSLVSAGILAPERSPTAVRVSEDATQKLFPAIRRNDIKAVASLLAKGPDLTSLNNEFPCGQSKIWDKQSSSGPTPACDAYTGVLFKANRRYAERFAERWVLLCAKYGFVDFDYTIPGPYNVTFKRKATAPVEQDTLLQQAKELRLERFKIVVGLGGVEFRTKIKGVFAGWAAEVRFPSAGLPIGKMLRVIKQAVVSDDPFPSGA